MKFHLFPSAVAAILGLSAMTSYADTLLLSDNFTVTTPMGGSNLATAEAAANQNLANRQSGLYAGSQYVWAGNGYNVQTGNTSTTLYPGPSVLTNGNYLLLAQTGVQNVLPIDFDLADGHAITISFDMYAPNSSSSWGAFTLSNVLGGTNAAFPTTAQFGFLAQSNGRVQIWNAGTSLSDTTQSAVTGYPSASWTVVLSDVGSGTGTDAVAGTGSPFGGDGTYVAIYYGDTLVDGRALTSQFGDQTLYLGFYGQPTTGAGFDNLSVSTVPEPASVAYLAAGLGFMLFVARRRRASHA